jgi:glycosyltransferase involved in cell wall biosynthesis
MAIKISAIVCTYNGEKVLEKAIQSLLRQTLNKKNYEILVVDNGSTDGTRNIIRQFQSEDNLRYIFEPELGLSKARNTGWQMAQGEFVAYLDDDAIACPKWLERILNTFRAVPEAGVIGGRVNPIWEAPRPTWLSDTMLIGLSVINWSEEPTFLNEGQSLLGGNVAYLRRLLKKTGGFSPELGRKGNCLLSNEENLLIMKIKEMGFKEYYHPGISIEHLVPADKLRKDWFEKRYYWQGISDARLDYWQQDISTTAKFLLVSGHCLRFIKYPGMLFHLLVPSDDKRAWDMKIKAYHKLGYMKGILSLNR